MEDIRLKDADLRKAATESGGEYFTIDRANELLDLLPDSPRQPLDQPCPPLALWNHPLLFALTLMTLIAEWLLRKRAGLL